MFPSVILLGPFTFRLYGIIFAVATMTGFFVAKKRAKIYKIPEAEVENIFFLAIPLGILFSRLYHVFHYFSYYQKNPFKALAVWEGGLGIFGGILGGILGVWLYARAKRLNFFKVCDLLAPGLALGQAIGRWGNFVNQEAFGPPTSLPWKIYISPQNRPDFWDNQSFFQPLFLYESIWDFLNFLILLLVTKRFKNFPSGMVTAFYFIIYGTGRFFLEFWRFDTAQFLGIKVAHILSLAFVFAGLSFFVRRGIMVKNRHRILRKL